MTSFSPMRHFVPYQGKIRYAMPLICNTQPVIFPKRENGEIFPDGLSPSIHGAFAPFIKGFVAMSPLTLRQVATKEKGIRGSDASGVFHYVQNPFAPGIAGRPSPLSRLTPPLRFGALTAHLRCLPSNSLPNCFRVPCHRTQCDVASQAMQ